MNETKKVYPSQINTKSLACRVPASDYVEFLQDALNKGINLNDWLLMKVYGSKSETKAINGEKRAINGDNLQFPVNIELEIDTNEKGTIIQNVYFDNVNTLISYLEHQHDRLLYTTNAKNSFITDLKEELNETKQKVKEIENSIINYLKNEVEWDNTKEFQAIKEEISDMFKLLKSRE